MLSTGQTSISLYKSTPSCMRARQGVPQAMHCVKATRLRVLPLVAGLYYWLCVHQKPKQSTALKGPGSTGPRTFSYMGSAAPIGTGWSSRWEDGPPKPFMPMPVRCRGPRDLVPCWRCQPFSLSQPCSFISIPMRDAGDVLGVHADLSGPDAYAL